MENKYGNVKLFSVTFTLVTKRSLPSLQVPATMNGQEAFRKLANQLKNAGGSGSPLPGAPKGLFAGSGLLITLIAGGFALNASLFNGKYLRGLCDLQLGLIVENSRWRPSCH